MNGINYNYFVYDCINNSAIVWLSISYVYKGLLQILAMFMAFHTRKIKIKALNDSKEIAVIIYINSITLSLLAFVEFALNDYHEVYAALFGLALLVGATLFLTLLFIPKVRTGIRIHISQGCLRSLLSKRHHMHLGTRASHKPLSVLICFLCV